MSNRKLISRLLLLALLGLSAACSTLTVPPGDAAPAGEADSEESAGDDSVAAPLPNVELTPGLLYRLLAAEFANQEGAPHLAAEQYLKSAAETRDPRLAKRATRLAVAGNNRPLALQAATLWGELAPDDLEASQAQGSLLVSAGRPQEARPHLERLIHAASAQGERGYLLVANLLGHDSDKERALGLMRELIADHQHEPAPLYAYATLAAQQENTAVALQTLETLLAIQPDHLQGLILKSRLLHAAGRKSEAVATVAEAVKLAPENSQLRLIYARMLVDEQRLDDARREFRTINRQSPDNPDVLYALGLLALQENRPNEAEGYLQRLLQLEQREAEANYALGQIAESRNDIDKAIRYYEAVDSGENELDAHLRIAILTARQGGLGKARDYLHALTPDNGEDAVRITLLEGDLLRSAQQYREALEVYSNALTHSPNNAELLYARAMAAERLDRLDILEADLRAILRQAPNHTQALNALGYTLAERTDRLQEAHELVSRALQLAPDDAAILDSMGWVLHRLGRNEESLDYLQRALRQEADPEIASHLGEVLWVTGKQKEARKVWDDALKRWPNHPQLRQTIDRLTR